MNSASGHAARQMIEKALNAVAEEHGLKLFDVVLVRPGALPRTTSGKIQRDGCRMLYLSGELARTAYDSYHPSLGRNQAGTTVERPASAATNTSY
jgi:hypothetical protein